VSCIDAAAVYTNVCVIHRHCSEAVPVSLSAYLPCLPACLPCLSACLCCLSACLSACLVCLPVCLPHLHVCLSALPACLPVLSVCLPVRLPCLSACLPVCLPHLPVCRDISSIASAPKRRMQRAADRPNQLKEGKEAQVCGNRQAAPEASTQHDRPHLHSMLPPQSIHNAPTIMDATSNSLQH